ncbi:MAG: hypothetical protein ACP5QT_02020 [Brevinematia bacterium]
MRRNKEVFLIFILPLSLIGAFFLPLAFKALLFLLAFFLLAIFNVKKWFNFIRMFFMLSISILPFLVGFLIGHKEGKIISFLNVEFYTDGIIKALNYFLLISIFSIFSFFLFALLIDPLNTKKKSIFLKRFSFLFLAMEYYQEFLKEFFIKIAGLNVKNIVSFVDQKYVEFKDRIKSKSNVNHQ